MDEATLKNLKLYIERAADGQFDDEDKLFSEGSEKLKIVLHNGKDRYSEEEYQRITGEILRFINSDEVLERKLYNYCLTFSDPYVSKNDERENQDDGPQSGLRVETHRYLNSDELMNLYEFIKNHKKDKTLGMVINQMLYDHGLSAPQVYNAAKLSRQDFSRMVNNNKGIGKSKIWNLIIGMRCDLDEADILLMSAGFARKNTVSDLIIEFFIRQKNYDIFAINDALYIHGQKPLSVYVEVRDKDSGAKKKKGEQ